MARDGDEEHEAAAAAVSPQTAAAAAAAAAMTTLALTPLHPLRPFEDCGLLEVAATGRDGRSEATRVRARYPLKLLTPRSTANASHSLWAYLVTFGGGLLAGDHVGLRVDVHPAATAVLATQASTKVYKKPRSGVAAAAAPMAPAATGAAQTMHARVASRALLAVLPEPIVCYADSTYTQTQVFELSHGGSVVLLDWLLSGRAANGERWQFAQYRSRNVVRVDGHTLFSDHTLLQNDEEHSLTTVAERMGKAHVTGTLVLVGPAVQQLAAQLVHKTLPPLTEHCFRACRNAAQQRDATGRETATPQPFFFASASALEDARDGAAAGCVIRFMAESSADAYVFVQQCLQPLQPLIGHLPFTGGTQGGAA